MMTRRPISTDALEATRRCFERYGADPARWPASEREAYGGYADTEELAPARAEALALDGFLGAANAPRMDERLASRMMADFDALEADRPARSGFFSALVDVLAGLAEGARLAPAGVSAGVSAGLSAGAVAAAALGVVAGVASADAGSGLEPETEAYAYLVDASPFLYGEEEVSQ